MASDKKEKKRMSIGKLLHSVIDGTILTRSNVLNALPFILFLAFLAIIYIANTYFAYKHIREINTIRNELKEIRFEYISLKSELINRTKQSEIVLKLSGTGIKESEAPPRKIIMGTSNNTSK
ncbi:MAG: FtsL-like putative cell division protein [Bacteroidota bacterium]